VTRVIDVFGGVPAPKRVCDGTARRR
jgi:hypothetical protein